MASITRLHRYVLGLTSPPPTPGPAVTEGVEEIVVHSPARAALRAQLHVPGTLRGGPLFGHFEGSTLHVLYAAPQGYRGWPSLTSPLAVDPHYALGWVDALMASSPTPVDWVGSWLAYPNSERGWPEQDLRWVRRGWRAGILDDQTVMLSVGWQDGAMALTGYRLLGSEITSVPMERSGQAYTGPEEREEP